MLSIYLTRTSVFAKVLFIVFFASASTVNAQPPQLSTNSFQLNRLVNQFVSNNPIIKKTEAAVQAAKARLSGSMQALANPELAFDTERTDVSSYTLGISQTFDWHDKQDGLEHIARTELEAAKWQLANTKIEQTSEFLKSFGDIATFNATTSLSKRRVEILSRFLKLATQRFQVGDISQTELELARLALTESVLQHASNGADLIQAKTDFFVLNGSLLTEDIQIPDTLPATLSPQSDFPLLAKDHPKVKFFLQKSLAAKQKIKVTDRQRKIDPTIGLALGKDGDESLIGISLSIPFNVRNNFQSNVDEARAEALQAEQEAHQAYRTLLGKIQGAFEQYNLVAQAWIIWIDQGENSLQQRSKLLDIQWQSGEMNTTDYLIQLQQTIDTKIAGAELHNSLWQSWINWLSSTNTLANWLTTNSQGEK